MEKRKFLKEREKFLKDRESFRKKKTLKEYNGDSEFEEFVESGGITDEQCDFLTKNRKLEKEVISFFKKNKMSFFDYYYVSPEFKKFNEMINKKIIKGLENKDIYEDYFPY